MARSRVVKFGPGSLESVELRQWLRPRTQGAILVSEIRGFFTVYCGAGNEHTVEVTERVETHSASHLAEREQCGSLALGARAGNMDDAFLLAHELVEWALEDWVDSCDDGA